MVRKKCEWYPGSIHHITTRGNRRSDIFKDGEDYIIYLAILKEVKTKLPFELYCYCLMILSCFKDDNKRRLYQNFVESDIKLKASVGE